MAFIKNKPVIGIVGKPRNLGGKFRYILISSDVRFGIFKNGGLPIGVLPLDEKYSAADFTVNECELSRFQRENWKNFLTNLMVWFYKVVWLVTVMKII